MITRLRGTAMRLKLGELVLDVHGVGYAVSVPVNVWEEIENEADITLWISTYVREDRFELFGFLDQQGKTLFELLIAQSGIGPKMGLELCAVPRALLLQAIETADASLLTTVKGVGKKKAEKLLVELRSVLDKEPQLLGSTTGVATQADAYDQDAVDALSSLGYDTSTILTVLKQLPEDLASTEERVTAALRSL